MEGGAACLEDMVRGDRLAKRGTIARGDGEFKRMLDSAGTDRRAGGMARLHNVVLAALAIGSAPAGADPMEQCAAGPRHHCVVDGDTLWLHGEKIRLAGIDAPELDGARCKPERELAEAATLRLVELLAAGPPLVERRGLDRYGRTLATVYIDGEDVGAVLIAEGLARVWTGRREPWCG